MSNLTQEIELFTWHDFYSVILKTIIDEGQDSQLYKVTNHNFENLYCKGLHTYKFETSHTGFQDHFNLTVNSLQDLKAISKDIPNPEVYVCVQNKEFNIWYDFYRELIKSLIDEKDDIHLYQSESGNCVNYYCYNRVYCHKLKLHRTYSSKFKTCDKEYQRHITLVLEILSEFKQQRNK